MRILTLFAHPDDEVLACGATLSKLSKDNEIYVAIAGTGIYARRNTQSEKEMDEALIMLRENCIEALGNVGVKPENIYLGDFSDNEFDKHTRLELIHWFEKHIELVKPDIIFTHHRYCTNIDHQYCYEATMIAARPSVEQHIEIFTGEVPSATGYLKPTQFEPTMYVEVSEEDVDRKIKAMQTYKGEARPYPHPRSPEVLKALARVRGSEAGFHFAEAFMAQKIYGIKK